MSNEIEKIILTMDKGNIKGIIIKKKNSLERYGYSNKEHVNLLEIYSKYVRELKLKNKKEMEGLSRQETVNKLYSLNKIEYKNNIIVNIKVFDEGSPYERMVVVYDNKEEEIKLSDYENKNEYLKIKDERIKEISAEFNINKDNLIRYGLIERENKFEKVLKENKIRNFVIKNKRMLVGILTGVVTVTGIGVGIHKLSKREIKDVKPEKEVVMFVDTPSPKPTPNQTIITSTNTPEVTLSPTNTPNNTIPVMETLTPPATKTPEPTNELPIMEQVTPPPTIKPKDIEICGLDFKLVEPLNNDVLARKNYGEFVYVKGINIEKILSSLNKIREENMKYISKNLSDLSKDKDDLLIIYYENFIDNNLSDKAFIKYFSNIGNKIITSAYEGCIDDIIKYSELSNTEAIRLIKNNKPLEVIINGEKQELYFNELSNDAKEIIANISWNNNQCLNEIKEEKEFSNDLIVAKYFGINFYIFKEE